MADIELPATDSGVAVDRDNLLATFPQNGSTPVMQTIADVVPSVASGSFERTIFVGFADAPPAPTSPDTVAAGENPELPQGWHDTPPQTHLPVWASMQRVARGATTVTYTAPRRWDGTDGLSGAPAVIALTPDRIDEIADLDGDYSLDVQPNDYTPDDANYIEIWVGNEAVHAVDWSATAGPFRIAFNISTSEETNIAASGHTVLVRAVFYHRQSGANTYLAEVGELLAVGGSDAGTIADNSIEPVKAQAQTPEQREAWRLRLEAAARAAVTRVNVDITIPTTADGHTYVLTGDTARTFTTRPISQLYNGWAVVFANASTADLTFNPNGGETVNGEATRVIPAGEAIRVQVIDSAEFLVMADTAKGGAAGEIDDNSLAPAKARANSDPDKKAWRDRLGSSSIDLIANALPPTTNYNTGDTFIIGRGGATVVPFREIDEPATELTATVAGDVMMLLAAGWTRIGNFFSGGRGGGGGANGGRNGGRQGRRRPA